LLVLKEYELQILIKSYYSPIFVYKQSRQMKKYFLLSSVLVIWFSCTYKKGEIPKPNLTCVTDPIIHTVSVVVSDNMFMPSSVEILAGDTLKWEYTTGASVHTSTCDGTGGTALPSGGTTWDSGVMLPGDAFKKSITIPGTYNYICTVHGTAMSGTIVVKERCH
jgi:plastocyanin